MAESYNFRTAFNGFHREDVVHFLEYLNNKHSNQLNQLRGELAEAEKNAAAATELQAILDDLRQQYAELEGERDAALARADAMEQALIEARAEKSAHPASSGDELEAYRRAERTERMAKERAELIYHQVNGVLAEATVRVDSVATEIGTMADQVMSQLVQLQTAVSGSKRALQDAVSTMYAIKPNN